MLLAAVLVGLDVQTVLNSPLFISLVLAIAGVLIAAHPLLKLAALLDAQAAKTTTEHHLALASHAGASVARSLDRYLTANQQDVNDLLDPAKRAAAEAHLLAAAKSDAGPTVQGAVEAVGLDHSLLVKGTIDLALKAGGLS